MSKRRRVMKITVDSDGKTEFDLPQDHFSTEQSEQAMARMMMVINCQLAHVGSHIRVQAYNKWTKTPLAIKKVDEGDSQ